MRPTAAALTRRDELFQGLASGWLAVTTAVFVRRRPSAKGVTTRVKTALENAGNVPRLQVTKPKVCAQDPCDGVAETKVTPSGSVLVRLTPVASRPPRLRTVSV